MFAFKSMVKRYLAILYPCMRVSVRIEATIYLLESPTETEIHLHVDTLTGSAHFIIPMWWKSLCGLFLSVKVAGFFFSLTNSRKLTICSSSDKLICRITFNVYENKGESVTVSTDQVCFFVVFWGHSVLLENVPFLKKIISKQGIEKIVNTVLFCFLSHSLTRKMNDEQLWTLKVHRNVSVFCVFFTSREARNTACANVCVCV